MIICSHNNIEIAQSFFEDCQDYLLRYDKCIEIFYAVKSRRLKCFIDLRAAYECILKCIVAYHIPPQTGRRELISSVEKYSHNIKQLEDDVRKKTVGMYGIGSWGDQIAELPIALRYTLDGFDFLAAKEDVYYRTIGRDDWLDSFRAYIGSVFKAFGKQLNTHSVLISGQDISFEWLMDIDYNKFRK